MSMLRPRQFSGARASLQAGDNPAGSVRAHSHLESGSYIVGNFSFERDAHIEGVIIGDITAAGTVTIDEGARVTSQIRAGSVVVAGKVIGDISASKRIEIRRTALVFGDLTSPILLIEAGAGMEGHSTMPEQSSYSHEIESEHLQMGFPFFKARDQRVIRLATEFPRADQAMQADIHGILHTRNVLARFGTIPCDDCLKPIRWWNRRIWLVDGERCAHLQCWNGQLFLKALVADQIRRSQLMAAEITHSLRSCSEPSDNGSTKDGVRELPAFARAPRERVKRLQAQPQQAEEFVAKTRVERNQRNGNSSLHELGQQLLRHLLDRSSVLWNFGLDRLVPHGLPRPPSLCMLLWRGRIQQSIGVLHQVRRFS